MVHFYIRLCLFAVGLIIGTFIAIYCVGEKCESNRITLDDSKSYEKWFEKHRFVRKPLLWDTLRYSNSNVVRESEFLFNRVKVLCVILVRIEKNVKAAKDTWAKSCNNIKLVHITTKTRPKKIMPVKRTKDNSPWLLLCNTLVNISIDYDWVLVVNDNTFAIIENLRYLLASLNPNEKYYLGHAVEFWNTVYNSKEAGYVLSKGTLSAFKKKQAETNCSTNVYWNKEDFYLGKYLAKLNITPIDTRDSEGMSTFHPYNWYQAFFPGESYYKLSFFPVKCCSKHSIAFQAIEGDKMYTYHYLLYKLQLFLYGNLGNKSPINEVPDDVVWKTFLKERNIHNYDISSEEYYKIWESLVDDPNSFASQMKKDTDFDYD